MQTRHHFDRSHTPMLGQAESRTLTKSDTNLGQRWASDPSNPVGANYGHQTCSSVESAVLALTRLRSSPWMISFTRIGVSGPRRCVSSQYSHTCNPPPPPPPPPPHTHTHTHTYMYTPYIVHTNAHTHAHMHAHTHTHAHACTHTHICHMHTHTI